MSQDRKKIKKAPTVETDPKVTLGGDLKKPDTAQAAEAATSAATEAARAVEALRSVEEKPEPPDVRCKCGVKSCNYGGFYFFVNGQKTSRRASSSDWYAARAADQ